MLVKAVKDDALILALFVLLSPGPINLLNPLPSALLFLVWSKTSTHRMPMPEGTRRRTRYVLSVNNSTTVGRIEKRRPLRH